MLNSNQVPTQYLLRRQRTLHMHVVSLSYKCKTQQKLFRQEITKKDLVITKKRNVHHLKKIGCAISFLYFRYQNYKKSYLSLITQTIMYFETNCLMFTDNVLNYIVYQFRVLTITTELLVLYPLLTIFVMLYICRTETTIIIWLKLPLK